MKTHSGAKKRFKLTAKGQGQGPFTPSRAQHPREEEPPSGSATHGKPKMLGEADVPRVKKLLRGLTAWPRRPSAPSNAKKRSGRADPYEADEGLPAARAHYSNYKRGQGKP